MKSKRLFSMMTAVLMLITLMTPSALGAATDYNGHWAQSSILKAVQSDWINDDDVFRPGEASTLGEFVDMINRMMGFTEKADISHFTDISPENPHYDAFSIAYAAGYIKGNGDGTLAPDRPLLRYEAFIIFSRIADIDSGVTDADLAWAESVIPDWDTVPEWAQESVITAIKAGFVAGYTDGTLNGDSKITRAETTVLLDRKDSDVLMFAFEGDYTVKDASGITIAGSKVTVTVGSGANVNDMKTNSNVSNSKFVLTEGAYADTVIINGTNNSVVMESGSEINRFNVAAGSSGTTVTMDSESKIKTANFREDTRVTGSGEIDFANVASSGVSIQNDPNRYYVDDDVTAQIAGETVGGGAVTTTPSPTPSPTPPSPPQSNSNNQGGGGTTPTPPTPPTPSYTVTMQNDGNGTASANPSSAAQGTAITITANSNPGYKFKEWVLVSGGITLSSYTTDTATFTMPAGNVIISAEFELDGYTVNVITFGMEPGDSVSPQTSYNLSDSGSVTINYYLADTKANNLLTFSGVATVPAAAVTTAGSGSWTYNVNTLEADSNNVITITATFLHTDLIIDTIEFTNPHETRTFGIPPFTNAVSNQGSGSGAITYNSGNTSVADVNSASGVVTIYSPGTAVITAYKDSDGIYSHAYASYVLTVDKADPSVTWPSVLTATYGQTLSQVTITGGTGTPNGIFTWQSPGSSVGNAGSQSHIMVFTPNDTTNYNAIVGGVTITVNQAPQAAPTGLGMTRPTTYGGSDGTITGATAEMECRVMPSGIWTNTNFAGGAFTGLVAATYEVRYKADANHLAGASATVTVDPYQAGPMGGSATISGTSRIGQTLNVSTASITNGGSNSFNYQWRRGDTTVGTNSSSYGLTGADAGSVITCIISSADASATGSITATFDGGLTVPYDIVITNIGNVGGDVAVTAASTFGRNGAVITLNYILANENVNNALTFTGVTGLTNLTTAGQSTTQNYTVSSAHASGGVITITATFSHSAAIIRTASFADSTPITTTYGDSSPLVTARTATVDLGIDSPTYTSSDTNIATVNASTGQVTLVANGVAANIGTTTITATFAASGGYTSATANYNINVGKAAQTAPATGLFTATPETSAGANNGHINGITTVMEWKLDSASGYTDGSTPPSNNLTPGIYLIRYKETATHEASADTSVTVNSYTWSYTVTFDMQGSSTSAPSNITVASPATTITLTEFNALPNPPVRTNFDFVGWFTTNLGTAGSAFSDTTIITGNTTVYAVWKANTPTATLSASPPAVDDTVLLTGLIDGIEYEYIMTNGGGSTAPQTFTASGTTQSFVFAGIIGDGSETLSLKVTGTANSLASDPLTLTITAVNIGVTPPTAVAPTITSSTLPNGTRETSYSETLAATGDTPITWSVESGNLPDGLSLNTNTGAISGTPSKSGTFSFTVKAVNTTGDDTKALTINIARGGASGNQNNQYSVSVGTATPVVETDINNGEAVLTGTSGGNRTLYFLNEHEVLQNVALDATNDELTIKLIDALADAGDGNKVTFSDVNDKLIVAIEFIDAVNCLSNQLDLSTGYDLSDVLVIVDFDAAKVGHSIVLPGSNTTFIIKDNDRLSLNNNGSPSVTGLNDIMGLDITIDSNGKIVITPATPLTDTGMAEFYSGNNPGWDKKYKIDVVTSP